MLPHEFSGGRVRKLLVGETGKLRAHLLRLSSDDRRLRFCGHMSEDLQARYAEDRGPFDAVTLGWFVDGQLRAVGELIFLQRSTWGSQCEVALSVEGSYQNRGVGAELMRRIIVIARNRGVSSIVMWCLADNDKMRAIAKKLDASLVLEANEVEARVSTSWPTQLTLLEEAFADGAAVLGIVLGLKSPGPEHGVRLAA